MRRAGPSGPGGTPVDIGAGAAMPAFWARRLPGRHRFLVTCAQARAGKLVVPACPGLTGFPVGRAAAGRIPGSPCEMGRKPSIIPAPGPPASVRGNPQGRTVPESASARLMAECSGLAPHGGWRPIIGRCIPFPAPPECCSAGPACIRPFAQT